MSMSLNAYLGICAKDAETLSFGIDIAGHKSTTNAVRLFQEEVEGAIDTLPSYVSTLAQQITSFRQRPIGDETAHSVLLSAYEKCLLSSRNLRSALRNWEAPPHETLKPRNAFSLLHTLHWTRRSIWRTDPKKNLYGSMQVQRLVRSYVEG